MFHAGGREGEWVANPFVGRADDKNVDRPCGSRYFRVVLLPRRVGQALECVDCPCGWEVSSPGSSDG